MGVPRCSGPRFLSGDGVFELEVVGESHYQQALEAAVGGRSAAGADLIVEAILIAEDTNPYDSKAIRLDIGGRTVGYLRREEARRFRAEFGRLLRANDFVCCKANIRGGWSRGSGDRGHFGVWLDVRDQLRLPSPAIASGRVIHSDVADGLRFYATLKIRTPLVVLEHHGGLFRGPGEPAAYGPAADGIWLPNPRTWKELGIDLSQVPESEHASDIGPIRPGDYLPFLKEFRSIVESCTSVHKKLIALHMLRGRSPFHEAI